MRPLIELTRYEMLDLPAAATPFEIRKAYKRALEVYSEDSMVIYSLFFRRRKKGNPGPARRSLRHLDEREGQVRIRSNADSKRGHEGGGAIPERQEKGRLGGFRRLDRHGLPTGRGKTPGRGESGGQRNPLPGGPDGNGPKKIEDGIGGFSGADCRVDKNPAGHAPVYRGGPVPRAAFSSPFKKFPESLRAVFSSESRIRCRPLYEED